MKQKTKVKAKKEELVPLPKDFNISIPAKPQWGMSGFLSLLMASKCMDKSQREIYVQFLNTGKVPNDFFLRRSISPILKWWQAIWNEWQMKNTNFFGPSAWRLYCHSSSIKSWKGASQLSSPTNGLPGPPEKIKMSKLKSGTFTSLRTSNTS